MDAILAMVLSACSMAVSNDSIAELPLKNDFPDWDFEIRQKSQANKERLRRLLGGGDKPGLLLVSCHGQRIDPKFPDHQKSHQGALFCQAPKGKSEAFSSGDLAPETRELHGLISFFFSCYGAGTPDFDNFPHVGLEPEAALATELRLSTDRAP